MGWQLVTDVHKAKQGAALLLNLPEKDRDIALDLPITEINSEVGVDSIINKLSKIYKKDSVDAAYEDFENFINFKRPSDMSISNFITEFETRYAKTQENKCSLSTNILAYFLLNQAQLSENNNKLVRATLDKLEYEEMKTKLRKVFGSSDEVSPVDVSKVKIEDINLMDDECEALYGRYY